jgi:hypothetical protein
LFTQVAVPEVPWQVAASLHLGAQLYFEGQSAAELQQSIPSACWAGPQHTPFMPHNALVQSVDSSHFWPMGRSVTHWLSQCALLSQSPSPAQLVGQAGAPSCCSAPVHATGL